MITHKILQVVKKLVDESVASIFVQIELSDGKIRLGYDTNLDPSAESDLKTAIENFIAEKQVEFEELATKAAQKAAQEARTSHVKLDEKAIHVDAAKIDTKAQEIKDEKAAEAADVEAEITPAITPPSV